MSEIISMTDRKRAKEKAAYSRLVLAAWDEREHEEKRRQLDRRAEIERKGRERL